MISAYPRVSCAVMAEDNTQKVQQAIDLLLPLIASTPNPSGEGPSSSGSEPPGLHGAPSQSGMLNIAVAS